MTNPRTALYAAALTCLGVLSSQLVTLDADYAAFYTAHRSGTVPTEGVP